MFWELILCFFAALGLVTLCWVILGFLLRPWPRELYLVMDLEKIPEDRWEHTLRCLRWLWDLGLLPGRVLLRNWLRAGPLACRILREYPFTKLEGEETPHEEE